MGKRHWLNLVLLALVLVLTAQVDTLPLYTGSVPEAVRRPDQFITPSYPRDLSIGETGPGEAPLEAYHFARRVLGDAQQKREASAFLSIIPSATRSDFLNDLGSVTSRKYRVGSGRTEVDGSTSFLFRFIGREQELAGEIYLRSGESGWVLEDIISEEPRNLDEARDGDHPYSWTPYDSFW